MGVMIAVFCVKKAYLARYVVYVLLDQLIQELDLGSVSIICRTKLGSIFTFQVYIYIIQLPDHKEVVILCLWFQHWTHIHLILTAFASGVYRFGPSTGKGSRQGRDCLVKTV